MTLFAFSQSYLGAALCVATLCFSPGCGESPSDWEEVAAQHADFQPGYSGGLGPIKAGHLRVYVLPGEGAILCDLDMLRLVLLDRTTGSGFGGYAPVEGEERFEQNNLDASGEPYWSYRYAEGSLTGELFGLPLTYQGAQLIFAGSSFVPNVPQVVLVSSDNEIVHASNRQHTGLADAQP